MYNVSRTEPMFKVDTKAIDGLRGLATIHIMLNHMVELTDIKFLDFGGSNALGLFYVISGFVMILAYGQKQYSSDFGSATWFYDCIDFIYRGHLLPYLPQRINSHSDIQGASKFPISGYLVKRYARMVPMYYLTNLLSLPYYLSTSWFLNVMYTLLLSSWCGGHTPSNGPTWTLSTIVFFYWCYPWIVTKLQNYSFVHEFRAIALNMFTAQLTWFVVLAVMYALLIVLNRPVLLSWLNQYYQSSTLERKVDAFYLFFKMLPLARVPVFFMGCCAGKLRLLVCADTRTELQPLLFAKNDITSPLVVYCVAGAATAVLSRTVYYNYKIIYCLSQVIPEILFPVLYFDWVINLTDPQYTSSLQNSTKPFFVRFLRSAQLQFLGRISLNVYLLSLVVHWYVAYAILSLQGETVFTGWHQWDVLRPPFWSVPISASVTIFLGWLLTDYFEDPLNKLIVKLVLGDSKSVGGSNYSNHSKAKGASSTDSPAAVSLAMKVSQGEHGTVAKQAEEAEDEYDREDTPLLVRSKYGSV